MKTVASEAVTEANERRRPRRRALMIAAVLVGAIAIAWGVIGVASAIGEDDPSRYIAALGPTRTAVDELPHDIDASGYGHSGVSADTSHFVGSFHGVRFWVARNIGSGELCLISQDSLTGTAAGACAPANVLQSRPLSLAATSPGPSSATSDTKSFEAFLIGDSFADARVPRPWVKVGHNLIVVDGESTTGKDLTVTSESESRSLTIRRFAD